MIPVAKRGTGTDADRAGPMLLLLPALVASLRLRGVKRALTRSAVESTFTQWCDHHDHSLGTFPQRYYENADNAPGDLADVKYAILSVGGESDSFGADGDGDFIGLQAKDLHAVVFTVEHRYFGTSFPSDASSANYARLHTVDQALNDFANFATQTAINRGWSNVKWLAAGGSYSGLVSALLRQNFSNVFHAAFSSSGVVEANDNFTDFDLQIAIAMGQECASVARAVRLQIEDLWADQKDWVLSQFGCDLETPDDFWFVLGDIFSLGPQYSRAAKLCDPLVDTLRTKADPFMVLAQFSRDYFVPKFCDGNVSSWYSRNVMQRQASATSNAGARSWQWMTCNELGYWQTTPGRTRLRAPGLTAEAFEDNCRTVFKNASMPPPDVDGFNQRHNVTKGNNVSHVAFITNSQDPWAWTCVGPDIEVDPDNWVYTIKGHEVGHHREFNKPALDDPEDMKRARENLILILDKWLGWKKEPSVTA